MHGLAKSITWLPQSFYTFVFICDGLCLKTCLSYAPANPLNWQFLNLMGYFSFYLTFLR